jgi:ribonuclease HII
VGTVIFYNLKVAHAFRGVRDSKKLSAEKREYWLSVMEREKKLGTIDFAVSLVSAQYIDTYGIVKAIQKGIRSNLKKLSIEPEYQILLDGGLRAPNEFLNQKTIIKGDEKFRVISLASIVAKVHRDRKMVLCGKKYPKYGFEIHKGYGTLLHRNAIYKYGVSAVHRKSFLKNFVNK